jgi:hypothetical protein
VSKEKNVTILIGATPSVEVIGFGHKSEMLRDVPNVKRSSRHCLIIFADYKLMTFHFLLVAQLFTILHFFFRLRGERYSCSMGV